MTAVGSRPDVAAQITALLAVDLRCDPDPEPPAGARRVFDDDATMGEELDLATVEFLAPAQDGRQRTLDRLPAMSSLRVIQMLSAGVDWIVEAVPPGVLLCDGRGVHDPSTAEWVLAAILASIREVPAFVGAQRAGLWTHRQTAALAGSTVLIVGYGSIGAAVEARLAPFEVEVLRVARRARPGVAGEAELPALLPKADVVVLLVPLVPATRGLVDAAFLARLRDGALLVNAARGPVVDTGALLAKLATGRIRAALDVTDPEPLPAGHPLWRAPNLLLTPHVAGATALWIPRARTLVYEQLARYAAGEPLHNLVTDGY